MLATEVLDAARAQGVELTVDGDALLARPRAALTPELRDAIRQHKPALLELLREGKHRGPFRLTPRETAEATAAWMAAGCPGNPMKVGLALIRLRQQCRRCSSR